MRVFALVPLALCLFFSLAQAAEHKDDPFLVTAACDDAKSRATTIRLLDYVDQIFGRYHRAKPMQDSVTIDSAYEDGPEIEMHEATFRNFRASFEVGNDGKRILWSLTAYSTETGHLFRRKLDTRSSANWTRVPGQTGHCGRSDAGSKFGFYS